MQRDYESAPVAEHLDLAAVIRGLAGDLEQMRSGKITAQDGLARAAVAKQLFNGARIYLQAANILAGRAKPLPTPSATDGDANG